MPAGEPSDAKYRIDDWLTLHGIDRHRCKAILARVTADAALTNPRQRGTRSAIELDEMTGEQAWIAAADAIARRYPMLADTAKEGLALTRTNFAPDESRFPRAFTLHDDGAGRPYVSCPYHGTTRDLMAVAHEFGHALQLTASRGAFMPPVLREACAFISELAMLHALDMDDPSRGKRARLVWEADTHRQLTTSLRALMSALEQDAAPYTYQWNYPVARILAIEADRALDAATIGLLFEGHLKTTELCNVLKL